MKLSLGKILHVALQVAPHVVPLVGLANDALKAGKKAAKDHDSNILVDVVSTAERLGV